MCSARRGRLDQLDLQRCVAADDRAEPSAGTRVRLRYRAVYPGRVHLALADRVCHRYVPPGPAHDRPVAGSREFAPTGYLGRCPALADAQTGSRMIGPARAGTVPLKIDISPPFI